MHDWTAIVEEHGSLVWQTAYRLLSDEADAADCFQEVFLAAVELSRRQQVRNIGGLLSHLATVRAIDKLRRRIRDRHHQSSLAAEFPSHHRAVDPLRCAANSELADRLSDALTALPPREAEAFCLRYLSGMSYREIAQHLGISTGFTGVLLYRAKARLREQLSQPELVKDEVPL